MADETEGRHDDVSHTTVIHERGSSGSGVGIIVAVILLLAVIAGIYLFTRTSSTEVARDNAITNAANSVGNAADQVGDAAQDAANNAGTTPDNADDATGK